MNRPKAPIREFRTTENPCASCEHPEFLSMLLPRIEDFEKRVKDLEENQVLIANELRKLSNGEIKLSHIPCKIYYRNSDGTYPSLEKVVDTKTDI